MRVCVCVLGNIQWGTVGKQTQRSLFLSLLHYRGPCEAVISILISGVQYMPTLALHTADGWSFLSSVSPGLSRLWINVTAHADTSRYLTVFTAFTLADTQYCHCHWPSHICQIPQGVPSFSAKGPPCSSELQGHVFTYVTSTNSVLDIWNPTRTSLVPLAKYLWLI